MSEAAAGAAAQTGVAAAQTTGGVSAPQLPLAFVSEGQTATILNVRGNEETHRHLENLGFVEGAEAKVVTENAGNLIVEVKGAQVALDKHIAMKIVCRQ